MSFSAFGPCCKGVFEGCDQSLILGEVVGLMAEILAELRDFTSGLILDDDAVAGGPGIAARTAVAMGNKVMLGRIFAVRFVAVGKQRIRVQHAGG